jgi:hypothetical protein
MLRGGILAKLTVSPTAACELIRQHGRFRCVCTLVVVRTVSGLCSRDARRALGLPMGSGEPRMVAHIEPGSIQNDQHRSRLFRGPIT